MVFELRNHPDAVALQFDVVSSNGAHFELTPPTLDISSPHSVESNRVSSGAIRYVVYSTAGQPISAGRRIHATFQSQQPPANGILAVTNLVDSNASGQRLSPVSSAVSLPNILPFLPNGAIAYRSALVGHPNSLSASIVDLDGTVASVTHRLDGQSKGSTNSLPYTVAWTPDSPGLFAWSALATDNRGGSATLDMGSIRAYQTAEITSFATFGQIHYGGAANPGWLALAADPLGIGIENGVAHLLGINPHDPDRSRLPQGKVEAFNGLPHFVFRFVRSGTAAGISWKVWETNDLADWFGVPTGNIVQTPLGGGLTEVLVRRPLSTISDGKIFMQLEASE